MAEENLVWRGPGPEPTMNIVEFMEVQLDPELDDPTGPDPNPANTALVGLLCLLRSVHQEEVCTNEGAAASYNEWVRQHGTPTVEKVRVWVESLPPKIKGVQFSLSYLEAVMNAE